MVLSYVILKKVFLPVNVSPRLSLGAFLLVGGTILGRGLGGRSVFPLSFICFSENSPFFTSSQRSEALYGAGMGALLGCVCTVSTLSLGFVSSR